MSDETQDQADQRDADQDESQHEPETGLGDKGAAALREERDARKRAEKRIRELEKADAERQEQDRKRSEAEQAEQGKWKELAEKRDADLAEKTTTLEAVTAERDTLLSIVAADVESTWKTIPDEVREAYDGADDDVLAKKQHMTRNAKIIARLQDAGEKPGHPRNPESNGGRPEVKSPHKKLDLLN